MFTVCCKQKNVDFCKFLVCKNDYKVCARFTACICLLTNYTYSNGYPSDDFVHLICTNLSLMSYM